MAVLEISQLKKSFVRPEGSTQVVVDVPEFSVEEKAHCALRGASGSGKTTFLNLISGILAADEGRIMLAGTELSALRESERDRWRAQKLGYVFQTFNLLQGFTCLENVLLGMSFSGVVDRGRARELLQRVGLADRMSYFPRQLSTGQQQRVAVARALASQPKLVLADEPTGNLDPANAREVLRLIREVCTEQGAALLLVSHDEAALAQFERVEDFHRLNRVCFPPSGG